MTELTFLGCDQDAYCASVGRHIDEFEEASGHAVRVRILASDEYFSNDLGSYLTGDAPADVFMSGPMLVWQHVGGGLVEPLDPYLERASDAFDPGDFVSTLLHCNRWSGVFGEPLGVGPLLEVPVNCESYNLAFVPEILDRAGVGVPKTWSDYFAAACAVVEGASPSRGFAQRGTDAWHTIYTGIASQLWACGARDFDDSGACALASPASVKATTDLLQALVVAGPVDWPNQRWYELALDFAAGRYGLIVDSDHYVAYFEDDAAQMKGRIDYRLPPAGEGGEIVSNLWTWSVAMNARSRHKDEAWELIEWATGSAFLKRAAFEGNMNPTRRSTWDDAEFLELASGWGDFGVVARTLIEDIADVLVTPSVDSIEIARRWTRAVLDGYHDIDGVEGYLGAAAADIDRLVATPP